ncbi:MAG: SatD family protein [Halanaerobiales bacterium]
MNKWVIVGDIKNSRKMDNRKEVQIQLEEVLKKINQKYNDAIYVSFKITLGDEFYGVLNDYSKIIDIIWELYIELPHIEFRFGLGYGDVSLNDNSVSGNGYNNAIQAVKKCKKDNYNIHLYESEINGNIDIASYFNIIFHLYFTLLNNYTVRQRLIIYLLSKDKRQKDIAAKLDVTQTSISQSIQNINWRLLKKIYQDFPDMPLEEVFHTTGDNGECEEGDKYLAFIGRWDTDILTLEEIQSRLDRINSEFKSIQSRFITTVPQNQGHEFQGLLQDNPVDMVEIIIRLLVKIETIVLGIGRGDIKTELKESAIGMDGTSFYRARKAVDYSGPIDKKVRIETEDSLKSDIFTVLISLFAEFINSWTGKQAEVVLYRHRGLKQKNIASELGVKRVTVADHLSRADWSEYKVVYDSLLKILKYL